MTFAVCAMLFTFSACGDDDDTTLTEKPQNPSGDDPKPIQGTLELMQTCTTCSGSKQCTTCHGTGKGCTTCHGKGEYCKTCGNSGECYMCNGNGKCYMCYGKGGEKCTWCLSKPGKCGKCVGTGMYGTARCTLCNGSGICHYCNGNYWKKCNYCSGTGDCNTCHGRKICQSCLGYPPTCTTCGGDGHCQACTNADGRCSACTGTGEMPVEPLSYSEVGGTEPVFVHCNTEWEAQADVDWIKLSSSSGKGDYTVYIAALANNTASARTGIVTFTCGDNKKTLSVNQIGEALRLSVEPATLVIGTSGGTQTISILCNSSWNVTSDESWLTCTPSSGSGDATIALSASPYDGVRYATVTITDGTGEASAEVNIAQAASTEQLEQLKTWLIKPMGVVDVDMSKASYYTIKYAVEKMFKIGYEWNGESPYNMFNVYAIQNPECGNMTYQGLKFEELSVSRWKYFMSINYGFVLYKSVSTDYMSYVNNIIKDFKYNYGVTLEKNDSYSSETYKYEDEYPQSVSYSVSVYQGYEDKYSIHINVYYYF